MSAKSKCNVVEQHKLPGLIELQVKEDIDFAQAKALADAKARESARAPMLLAWYDRKNNWYSPQVECCNEAKPSWVVYAESRGGDITIDINDEEYVFIYRDAEEAGRVSGTR